MGKRLKFQWKCHQRKPAREVLGHQLPSYLASFSRWPWKMMGAAIWWVSWHHPTVLVLHLCVYLTPTRSLLPIETSSSDVFTNACHSVYHRQVLRSFLPFGQTSELNIHCIKTETILFNVVGRLTQIEMATINRSQWLPDDGMASVGGCCLGGERAWDSCTR